MTMDKKMLHRLRDIGQTAPGAMTRYVAAKRYINIVEFHMRTKSELGDIGLNYAKKFAELSQFQLRNVSVPAGNECRLLYALAKDLVRAVECAESEPNNQQCSCNPPCSQSPTSSTGAEG